MITWQKVLGKFTEYEKWDLLPLRGPISREGSANVETNYIRCSSNEHTTLKSVSVIIVHSYVIYCFKKVKYKALGQLSILHR